MAQTSKRKQQLRRAKRRATIAERYAELKDVMPQLQNRLQQLTNENYQTRVMLFALLAQHGRPLEVTKGTVGQVMQNYAHLRIEHTPKLDDPETYVVMLVEEPPPEEKAPDLVIKKVEEEPATSSGAEDIGYDELKPLSGSF